jgi:predicted phosphodiesterase
VALALAGCASAPPPAGGIAFALMGDTPYSQQQANLLESLIDELNAEPLAFVAHVGDITSGRGPCGDEWLEARKRQFARIRHPFVLLPGDNDWTDCHREGLDPLERLMKWRALFCVEVALPGFVRQRGAHCENVRWESAGLVLVGVNVPGSNNNLGRTPQMDAEYAARMREVFAWLDEALARARGRDGLVVLLQANPFLEPRGGGPSGFDSLLEWLARAAEQLPGKVILVHGDTHRFRDDEPLPWLRRIEVWGSPHVRWLRARLKPDGLRIDGP